MCSFYFSNQYLGNFEDINKFLKPRGPDYTNIVQVEQYTLIHNLLSLTGEFTIQPIIKNDIYLLFNGEIYNYKELNENAKCDSDIIINLYEQHGVEFTKKLDGEYAIVLLDLKNQKIIFSSDVFRTKPIFYSINGDKIGISTYTDPLKKSKFSDVKKVEANSTYEFDIKNKTLKVHTIKNFDLNQYITNVDGWLNKFENAINKRIKYSSDKKYFIGLSSGYDSGAISCALNRTDVNYKAYSIAASENLNVINERLKLIKNKEFIHLKRVDFEYFKNNLFGNLVENFQSDTLNVNIQNDKASYGLAYICSLAKNENRKIYISGQGADEIISDYGMNGSKIYSHSTFGGKFPNNLSTIFPWRSFFKGTQELYIAKEEYVAGSFGIETRYPFLDVELVQEYLNLSVDLKNKKYKYVIHEYLTKNNYPFEQNKKIGFSADKNLI